MLVRADYTEKTVEVTASGPEPAGRELAGLAQREMRFINAQIDGLNPVEEMMTSGVWVPVETLENDEGKRETGVATKKGTVNVNPTEMLNAFSTPAARDDSWKPKVFISYSHTDEVQRKKLELCLKVLATGGVLHEGWHDRKLQPGERWDKTIRAELEAADVVLFLVSNAALASDYIQSVEMKRAFAREGEGKTVVVPVILEDCDWTLSEFKKFQALPENAKPVKKWNPHNDGWMSVQRELKKTLEGLRQKHGASR